MGQLPVRYGGHFDMLDTEEAMPPFCLNVLGEALCDGEQVGPFFWKSSLDQAELAIEHQCRQAEDFIVVCGIIHYSYFRRHIPIYSSMANLRFGPSQGEIHDLTFISFLTIYI